MGHRQINFTFASRTHTDKMATDTCLRSIQVRNLANEKKATVARRPRRWRSGAFEDGGSGCLLFLIFRMLRWEGGRLRKQNQRTGNSAARERKECVRFTAHAWDGESQYHGRRSRAGPNIWISLVGCSGQISVLVWQSVSVSGRFDRGESNLGRVRG